MVYEFGRSKMPSQAPSCSHCETTMSWYRTALRSFEPKITMAFYACLQCDRVAVVETVDGAAKAAEMFATPAAADGIMRPKRRVSEQ